jgi:DNA-binding CsgD family transcriptional regulator
LSVSVGSKNQSTNGTNGRIAADRRVLRGRRSECEVLDGLLEAVRGGESRVLVVRGETGVGKSALLEYVVGRASGFRVVRAGGVQSEMELPFAGLEQLCAPLLDRLKRLPAPQRDALSTAFGLASGAAPNRFLVGLAVLGLLSEVAEERPLLCVVDDAQWLDRASAQAMEFVARRLLGESIALVFAVREPSEELSGLPELFVNGLDDSDARELLGSVIPWPLDERVRDRIIAETRGNPLALLELPHGLTPEELAGGFGLPRPQALSGRIEDTFERRLALLPEKTQRLLLIAAAEPLGDPMLMWRAAGRFGISVEAAYPAEAEGLLEFGARVIFRHPLVRSAIYRSASPQERREAHRALAEATDSQRDPDRRAWHLAEAAVEPDEEVASELERSADRAQARGGLAAAAAFLERSAALTPEPRRRAERALAAAQVKAQAGAFDAALRLLAIAEAGPLDELEHARAELLRGQIAFAANRGGDAPRLLLKAAKRFEGLDVRLARETYLEALTTAVYAARFVPGSDLGVAEAAAAAPRPSPPPSAPDLLLDGLALLMTESFTAAAPTLKRAVRAFSSPALSDEEGLRWLWFATPTAVRLWDDESWDRLSARHVELARDAGALGVLPVALNLRAGLHLYQGEFAAAASLIDEAASINEATGSRLPPYSPLGLAAFRGRDLAGAAEGVGLSYLQWATAVLRNGEGRYEDALAATQRIGEDAQELVFPTWAAVEAIEAASRSGAPERAASALKRVSDGARASGSNWGLGIDAYAHALVSNGEAAEHLYREALERLGRTRIRWSLARAHLVYGEWLRRERRRTDARAQLRIAHELFVGMGADGFAERARRELRATGGAAPKRSETRSQLTPQETQVARLARDGLSNPEIGARLFISPSTVAYHLHKVFAKLGISSRGQLHVALPERAQRDDPVAARSS